MSQPQRDRSRVSSAPSSKPGTEAAGGPRHFLAAATATAAAPVPPHSPPRPTHGHTPSLFRTRSSCGTAARSSITAPDPRPPPTPKPLQDGAPGRAPLFRTGRSGSARRWPRSQCPPSSGQHSPPQPPSLSSHQSPRPLTCRARPPPGPVPFHSRPLRTIARPVAGWAWPRAHPRPRLFPPIAGRRQSSLA